MFRLIFDIIMCTVWHYPIYKTLIKLFSLPEQPTVFVFYNAIYNVMFAMER